MCFSLSIRPPRFPCYPSLVKDKDAAPSFLDDMCVLVPAGEVGPKFHSCERASRTAACGVPCISQKKGARQERGACGSVHLGGCAALLFGIVGQRFYCAIGIDSMRKRAYVRSLPFRQNIRVLEHIVLPSLRVYPRVCRGLGGCATCGGREHSVGCWNAFVFGVVKVEKRASCM